MKPLLEIACFNPQSALIAQAAGADRIEFCDNDAEGGTTPSKGLLRQIRSAISIPLNVMVCPRGGGYVYSDLEFESMKEDILFCKEIGVDGIVIGILLPDYAVDAQRCRELLKLAYPMNATFHRAFDLTPDPFVALKTITDLGFDRLLTSGQKNNALEGAELIKALIAAANQDIILIPGGGVRPNNLKALAELTGAMEFHSAASIKTPQMIVAPSGLSHPAPICVDPEIVRSMQEVLSSIENHSPISEAN